MVDDGNNTQVIQAESASVVQTSDHHSLGAILEIARNGKIVYVSSGLTALTDLETNKIIGWDVNRFLEKILGEEPAKQLAPLVAEVLRGTREFLESTVAASNHESEAPLYHLQLEAASDGFNRSILFIQDANTRGSVGNNLYDIQLRSMRILEKGNLIFLRSNLNLEITEILGDTEGIFGVGGAELEDNPNLWWELISPEDYKFLNRVFYRLIKRPQSFTREIRFHHKKDRKVRWLLFSAIPLFSGKKLIGWEGFGLDITDKKEVEVELRQQKNRYNTLYDVALGAQKAHSPDQIALAGLSSLLQATELTAGVIWQGGLSGQDLQVSASVGFDQKELEYFQEYLKQEGNLVKLTTAKKYAVVMQELAADMEGCPHIFLHERFGAAIVLPMIVPVGKQLVATGAVILFADERQTIRYEDFDLATTAANQIALGSYQAQYFDAERKQANSLNLLYRLSRELAKVSKPDEIASTVFVTIQKVFPIKRIWFGRTNSSGSHLIGIKGYGPGMRDKINKVQIELGLRHDFLDQAISEKRPVVFGRNDSPECSKLKTLFERLDTSTIVLVPMVSIGQVVGLIAVEPESVSNEKIREQLALLTSIANEAGAGMVSHQLESQLVKADKMRMAGLLVSGVAHNFNNLLQAVLGRASLLENALKDQPDLKANAKMIVDAATQGAELVRKMAFFSDSEHVNPTVFDLSQLIDKTADALKSEVAPIALEIKNDLEEAKVVGDYFNIQQAVTSLVANAGEAVNKSTTAKPVKLNLFRKEFLSGEVDYNLPPGEYFCLEIIDHGVGMDERQLERCFEPFYTTKDFDEESGVGYVGSGLSLTHAYTIIESHGGLIVARSRLGLGSTFSIYLPIYKDKAQSKTVMDSSLRRVAFVVGEFDDSAEWAISALKKTNYKLITLAKRSEILSYFSQSNFLPDLLLVDLDKSSTDLVDFLTLIKDRYEGLNVICFSSDPQPWSDLLRFIDDIYLMEKPLRPEKYYQILKKILSKKIKMVKK